MSREIRRRLELDATPEQVWEAIATGPGITSWFVPTDVEPREGGAVTQDFGGGATGTGTVQAVEPGRRFVYGPAEEPPSGRDAYAFEFLVEGRDGGSTVLTFVHSGFGDGAEWDGEYDGYTKGWDLFLLNLLAALTHFPGARATGVVSLVMADGAADDAWPVLLNGLGLGALPSVGDDVTLAPDGPAPIKGVVDLVTPEFLGVRSAHGRHCIGAEGTDGCGISAYHYFYGDPVDAPALTTAWQGWLDGLFPRKVTP